MQQYGLIGFPLGHSFSKRFFTEKFEKENIDAQYELYELENITAFSSLVASVSLQGLNVTIPYKEQVISYLQELDATAVDIGAVNVIKFIQRDNQIILKGYNTDAVGFQRALEPFLQPWHQQALILGTGGASKAIEYSLRKMGIHTCNVSRTANPGVLTYQDLTPQVMQDYLLIINASPVGTYPHIDECPQIPYYLLSEKHFLFDAVYNPAQTLFLKNGLEQGAQGINGESMLVGQALAAWEIWNSEDESEK